MLDLELETWIFKKKKSVGKLNPAPLTVNAFCVLPKKNKQDLV